MRKLVKTNLFKALWQTFSSRRLIAVFLLISLLLGLLTLGQTSSEGPVVGLESGNGAFPFYSNGTYHMVVFSYTSNGTPMDSQGVKLVFTNSTTHITVTRYGRIGADGMSIVNFTSNEPWDFLVYLQGPTGYKEMFGYGISPTNYTGGFLSYMTIYDHGFLNKAAFTVFYVNFDGKTAPQTSFRLVYSNITTIPIIAVRSNNNSTAGSLNSDNAFNGVINLGSKGNFSLTYLYPNYNLIPSNITSAYGVLQYNNGSGWRDMNNFGQSPSYKLFVRPSEKYIEPQAYYAFFNTDILFVSLFGILVAILSFGYPRATHSIDLLVAKPLTRSEIIVSKYIAGLIWTCLVILSALAVTDVLFQYYFGIVLNAGSFLLILGVSFLAGSIFLSLSFLVAAVSRGFLTIFAIPLAIFFFFYFVFGSFLDGLIKLLQTLGVNVSGILVYEIYFNPFQIVSAILKSLDLKLGIINGVLTSFPYTMSNLFISLFVWALIPIVLGTFLWKKSEL